METASLFAKKHGLERFLDDPAALNDFILKLLILQETMQNEASRATKRRNDKSTEIAVRRVAAGKFTVRCSGDGVYRYAVETGLRGSTSTVALFQRDRFVRMLRDLGVPEENVSEFCGTVVLDDDTLCIDREE